MSIFERRLEEAGLNSWPALQQILFDGWFVRLNQGYTKRANSVTPLYPSQLPVEEKITWCERLYQEHQLPAIFRLLSFSEERLSLDQLLAQRGYRLLDRSQVWSLALPRSVVAENRACQALSQQDWLLIYSRWSNHTGELEQSHSRLLQRIVAPALFAVLYQKEVPVACGLAVIEHEALGLFNVMTDPARRREGHGTQIITNMLAWGKQRGARYAYLQVVDTNLAAQQLYAKLGFQQSYQYWYRHQA